MSTTTHTHDDIMLVASPLSVGYCRGCGAWRVNCSGYDEQPTGHGLDSYQALIDHIASTNPRFDAALLRDLAGHASEVTA